MVGEAIPCRGECNFMKCQKCDKKATFHCTDLVDGEPVELHLCPEHAQEYLNRMQQGSASPEGGNMAAALANHIAQQMTLSRAAEELAQVDEEICPTCGISFFEFRNQSRLGCPNDYHAFEKNLEPLLVNIHGETLHRGKVPRRSAKLSAPCTGLIHMRREMAKAVEAECYEKAMILRDKIRKLESEAAGE